MRTLFTKTVLLPMAAAIAIGMSACGGGGGGGQPAPPSSPPPDRGTDPAPPSSPSPDPRTNPSPSPNPAPPSPGPGAEPLPPPGPGTAPTPSSPPASRNLPPTADAGGDFTTWSQHPVTLDGSASSDPEGGTLTFAWAQTGGPVTVTLNGASTSTPSFSAPASWRTRGALTFTLTATDPGGLSATDTVAVTVEDNFAPTANAGGVIKVTQGDRITLDGSGSSDPEGQTLRYEWFENHAPRSGLNISGMNTSKLSFTAPSFHRTYWLSFGLVVVDPGGRADTDYADIELVGANRPTADAGYDVTTAEDYPVTLDGSGSSDPDGDRLTYVWAQTGGSPTVTLSGASSARATFTAPPVTGNAALTFTLTVTDPGGLDDTDTVTVTVGNNAAPTADAGGDVTTAEGYPVALDGSGSSDPEHGTLTYAWAQTGGSPTVTLDGASTSAPTFTTPQVTGNTALTFTLTATDPGGLDDTDTVTITVGNNAAPTADAGGDVTTYEGHPVTLDGSGSSDPEHGTLTYAWTQTGGTPTVTLDGASTSAPTFTAPQVTGNTALTFTLTATDPGGLSATDTVTVTVGNNAAPTADAGDNFTIAGDYPVTLDGSGSSDPEHGSLTYAWAQTGGTPSVTLSGASTSAPTFTAPQVTANAALTFTLTATDPGGLSATDSVTVTVKSVNDAPTADAGDNLAISDGDTATLDGSGSSDPEHGDLTYAWTQSAGTPSVELNDADTAAPSFAAPQLSANASLTFELTVTDPGSAAATDTVTVTVTADDDTPTANAGEDFTIYEGDMAALDGSAGGVDPGDGPAAFAWAQTGGTLSVTLAGAATAAPTFTAPQVTADTELTFTLTVSDATGQSATDSVTVTVANVRPAGATVRTPGSGETLEPATAEGRGEFVGDRGIHRLRRVASD